MTNTEFNIVVKEQLERIEKVLVKKAGEYSLETDRLSVFKQAAGLTGETPEKALYGFMLKHIVSITDMIQSEAAFPESLWLEKMTDIHNYLILLQALLIDTGRSTNKEE
mgnify:CR=1 FL=1